MLLRSKNLKHYQLKLPNVNSFDHIRDKNHVRDKWITLYSHSNFLLSEQCENVKIDTAFSVASRKILPLNF